MVEPSGIGESFQRFHVQLWGILAASRPRAGNHPFTGASRRVPLPPFPDARVQLSDSKRHGESNEGALYNSQVHPGFRPRCGPEGSRHTDYSGDANNTLRCRRVLIPERRQKQAKADAILRRIDNILDEIEAEGERLEAGSPPEDLSGLEEQVEHLRLELRQLTDDGITPTYRLHG